MSRDGVPFALLLGGWPGMEVGSDVYMALCSPLLVQGLLSGRLLGTFRRIFLQLPTWRLGFLGQRLPQVV